MQDQRKTKRPQTEQGADTNKKPIPPKEIGGQKGPEPTRYGDWENNGIASDF